MNRKELIESCPFFDGWADTNVPIIKFPFKVNLDRVVIWQQPKPEKIGMFYLPDQMNEDWRCSVGVVVAVGNGFVNQFGKYISTQIKVGEVVVYDKHVPWEIKAVSPLDDKEYQLIRMGESDIHFIIDDDEEFDIK